jgi:putative tryptophan/tyrosine transport system substrate-binding protein
VNRRQFITLLGGAAAWPRSARAQEPGRVYRLGALIPAGRETPAVVAFFDEMRLLGFIEGRNLDVIPGGHAIASTRWWH